MPTTNAVSSATQVATTTAASSNSIMGKDAFLKLLVVQLQHQDPMNPMQDKDYIAQLAQFSSLEQMTNMNTTISALGQNSTFSGAMAMAGKWVEYIDGEGNWTLGKVDGVSLAAGSARLLVGDNLVELGHVANVYAQNPQS